MKDMNLRLRFPFALARRFIQGVFLRRIREADTLTDLDMAREGVAQVRVLVRVKREFPELVELLEHKLAKALVVFTELDPNDPLLQRKLTQLYGEMNVLLKGLLLEIHESERLLQDAEQELAAKLKQAKHKV